jgi:hypothetical protein
MDSLNDFPLTNIELISTDIDLNSLLNFSYNFDLLKGIIGALLKNQKALQKQVELEKIDRKNQEKIIEQLKSDIITIQEKYTMRDDFVEVKDQMKKLNEICQVYDEEFKKGKHSLLY